MTSHNKKIDYDQAEAMLRGGMKPKDVAERFGVRTQAVYMAQGQGKLPKMSELAAAQQTRAEAATALLDAVIAEKAAEAENGYCMVLTGVNGEPCMTPVSRTFVTIEGAHMALCEVHDNEFYGLCIACATPGSGIGETAAFYDALRSWSTVES